VKRLKVVSDLLLVLAVVLAVFAIVLAVKTLLFAAAAVFVLSVVFTSRKRRAAKKAR